MPTVELGEGHVQYLSQRDTFQNPPFLESCAILRIQSQARAHGWVGEMGAKSVTDTEPRFGGTDAIMLAVELVEGHDQHPPQQGTVLQYIMFDEKSRLLA